jgi:hypothetical protein
VHARLAAAVGVLWTAVFWAEAAVGGVFVCATSAAEVARSRNMLASFMMLLS